MGGIKGLLPAETFSLEILPETEDAVFPSALN
jgi:hypothetical protein